MILVTCSTYRRFWHLALTMLCLANADRPSGCEIEVVDDGTPDDEWGKKFELLRDLHERRTIDGFKRLPPGTGKKNRMFGAWMKRVIDDPRIELWLHLDDDLCFSADVLARAVDDFRTYLGRGLLYIFVNCWRDVLAAHKISLCNGPLWHVHELGGAAWCMSRSALLAVGNVFDTPEQQAGREEVLWGKLRAAQEALCFNRDRPYNLQHTANAESLLSGHQEAWRNLWSHDVRSGEIVDVPPYGIGRLRAAVDGGWLESFVRNANELAKVKIVLPT